MSEYYPHPENIKVLCIVEHSIPSLSMLKESGNLTVSRINGMVQDADEEKYEILFEELGYFSLGMYENY